MSTSTSKTQTYFSSVLADPSSRLRSANNEIQPPAPRDTIRAHSKRIAESSKSGKRVSGNPIDIAKAFDTIPHQALERALQRLSISATIRQYISSCYKHITTRIEYKGATTEITLRRGVKQGDPLSPYIFNAIMNPLLETLEQLAGYSIERAHTIRSIASADDLILVADDHNEAQELLTLTEQYFKKMGMTIAASKCASFQIKTARDS